MTGLHWAAFNGRDDCLVAIASSSSSSSSIGVTKQEEMNTKQSKDKEGEEEKLWAFVNLRDDLGKTALHYAAKRGASRKLRRKWMERYR